MKTTKMTNWLMGAVAATALLAGCNKSEKTDTVEGAVAAVEYTLDAVQVRAGNPDRANDALAAMALTDSGAGMFSWADKSVDGDGATYSGLSMSIDGGTIAAGKLEFDGLDMNDTGATFGSLSLTDISITPPEGESGAMKVSGVKLINPSPALANWVAAVASATPDAPPPAFPAFSEISFDAATLSGLTFDLAEPGEDVSISLGDIKMLGYSPTGVKTMSLNDISFDVLNVDADERVKFGLKEFKVTGVNDKLMGTMAKAMESSQYGDFEDSFMAGMNAGMYGDPVDPGFDSFTMSDITFDGEGVTFGLPKLDAIVSRNADGAPIRYETKPFTATLAADAEAGEWGAQLAGALGQIGYEKLEFSGEGVSTFDPANDTATYEKSTFALKDGFSIDFTGKLGGMKAYGDALAMMDTVALESGDPTAMMDAFSKLTLFNMELVITDASIVDRLLNLAAAQSGEDPEALRQQIVAMSAMAPMMAAQSGIDPEIATEVSTAIAGFIQKPGKLTISMQPSAPITAQTFTAPDQITKAALGLTAKAE